MKSTGVVRRVDELGRIVIPKELRKTFTINERDSLEIYVEDDRIILKKYAPACMFCDSGNGLISYKGRNICSDCAKEISSK